MPTSKEKIVGREFWSDGYFVSTVGQHGNEEIISKYVKNQGRAKEYKPLLVQQLSLFD